MPKNDTPDRFKQTDLREGAIEDGVGNGKHDLALIEMLEGMGLDLTQPRELNVGLIFPSEASANRAAEDVRALGFDTAVCEVERSWWARWFQKPQWVLAGSMQSPTDTFAMAVHRRDLERIAAAHGGDYDGWEVGVAEDGVDADGEGAANPPR